MKTNRNKERCIAQYEINPLVRSVCGTRVLIYDEYKTASGDRFTFINIGFIVCVTISWQLKWLVGTT